ncbi:hypothetical protein GDO78_001943 [Eleutherodactylus coqui]|uniref:Transcription termination factor 4, mitochondrial n=2 Tax=Eleutherodactylus coqui TaxID=57060 RepID=A0A8J6FVM9_ELECQ|nr:hypothetical protein GDO78_001943 [Eleutherodactylus coqui]
MSSIANARQELLDLGFSEEQAEKIQSMRGPPNKTPSVKELCLIGLNHRTILRLLEERPEFLKVAAKELRDRVDTLRSLGLGEGSLQASLVRCPALLSVPRSRLLATAQFLKSRCQFTSQQVQKILKTSPETLTQDSSHLEDVFQYLYFRMGGKQEEIVSCQAFETPFDEIRARHQFLERLGTFQPPNKYRTCPPTNPKVKEVIQLSEKDFLSRIAHSSAEEFTTFRKILEREEREGESHLEDTEDELSSDEDDAKQDSDSGEDSEDEDYKENVHDDKPNDYRKKK